MSLYECLHRSLVSLRVHHIDGNKVIRPIDGSEISIMVLIVYERTERS